MVIRHEKLVSYELANFITHAHQAHTKPITIIVADTFIKEFGWCLQTSILGRVPNTNSESATNHNNNNQFLESLLTSKRACKKNNLIEAHLRPCSMHGPLAKPKIIDYIIINVRHLHHASKFRTIVEKS